MDPIESPFCMSPYGGFESLRSDGKAVTVSLTAPGAVQKGDPAYGQGFHGVAMGYCFSGAQCCLEIALREHEFAVGATIVAGVGDILFISPTTGYITNTNTHRPFCKVTVAKDSNNVIWAVILPQAADGM